MKNMIFKALDFLKSNGLGFAAYAVFVNLLDDLIIPFVLGMGFHPSLGLLAFLGDLDFLTYPLYFVFASLKARVIKT